MNDIIQLKNPKTELYHHCKEIVVDISKKINVILTDVDIENITSDIFIKDIFRMDFM